MTKDDELAQLMLETMDTPIMDDVITPDFINWNLLLDRYKYLSHGEQATVDLACSITGRGCFASAPTGNHRSLWEQLGAVDEQVREQLVIVLHRLVSQ